MSSKVIGIDIGTGGTRAVLIDEKGEVLASATHEHVPFASPQNGWAEQDPHDWWHACRQALRKLLRDNSVSGDQIACVGLTGQMHGAVLLDEDRAGAASRADLVRSAYRAECRELNETIGDSA